MELIFRAGRGYSRAICCYKENETKTPLRGVFNEKISLDSFPVGEEISYTHRLL